MPNEIDINQAFDLYAQDNKNEVMAQRAEDISGHREYYDGEHDTQLTERQRKYLQLKMGKEFNANYCPIVVDALAEKLIVTGFRIENPDQAELVWSWWNKSRMDHWQSVIHTAAVRDGDAYVMIEWDDKRMIPVYTFEPAWDGASGVIMHYSSKRQHARFASKRWRTGEGSQERLNLYLHDKIGKFQRRAGDVGVDGAQTDWEQIEETDWTTSEGEPIGLPMVHFRNKDQGYNYGTSELRDVTPPQNALNKAIIDLVAAADTTAFRIYWMVGDDPTGLEVVPGSWIYSLKPPQGEDSAAIGHIPGEDLSKLIAFKDSLAIEIARVSRTPISYFQISKQRPREETLQQEEQGLVSKAKNRATTFGNSWEDAAVVAQNLWNSFGEPKDGELTQVDPELEISTLWGDFETRNDLKMLQALKSKKELGIPEEFLWEEMGYSPKEIEEIKSSPEYQTRVAQREALAMLGSSPFGGGDDEEDDDDETGDDE